MIQKAESNQVARAQTIVEVNPQVLREIADRIESIHQGANVGEVIQVPFTKAIIFQTHVEPKSKTSYPVMDSDSKRLEETASDTRSIN